MSCLKKRIDRLVLIILSTSDDSSRRKTWSASFPFMLIAPLGQPAKHCPHFQHSSFSITTLLHSIARALTGQILTHFPHRSQLSFILNSDVAMIGVCGWYLFFRHIDGVRAGLCCVSAFHWGPRSAASALHTRKQLTSYRHLRTSTPLQPIRRSPALSAL